MNLHEWMHLAELAPLALLLALRERKPEHVLIACAWAMSWLGDSLARYMEGSWEGSYVWLPAQLALVLMALLPRWTDRAAMVACVGVMAVLSYWVSAPGPDMAISIVGSSAIVVLSWFDRRYFVPLLAYFGFGTLFYLAMVEQIGTAFFPAWWCYQASRALAYVAFFAVVVRERRTCVDH